jgi:anti-sigma-K factor RskA
MSGTARSERDALLADLLLGELSAEDRPRAEALLRDDPVFRAEVERLSPIVGTLSELPPDVWTPPAPPPLRLGTAAPAAEPERAPRREHARWWSRLMTRPALVAAACLVLVAGGFGLGVLVSGGTDGAAAPGGPELTLAALGSADPGATGRAVLPPGPGGSLTLDVSGLAPSGPDDHYEVWLLKGPDDMVALGGFRVPEDGRATVSVPVPVDASGYRVDVSLEPNDGKPAHSGDSVLRTDRMA